MLYVIGSDAAKRNAVMVKALEELGIPINFPWLAVELLQHHLYHRLVNWSDPVMLYSYRIIKSGLSNKAYLHVLSLHINALDVKYSQTIGFHGLLGPQGLLLASEIRSSWSKC